MSEFKIIIGNDEIQMKSALVSGVRREGTDFHPTSMYGGRLDLEEIHSALFYANRAVIKMLVDEFKMPETALDNFLFSAVTEALTKEWNSKFLTADKLDIKRITKGKL